LVTTIHGKWFAALLRKSKREYFEVGAKDRKAVSVAF